MTDPVTAEQLRARLSDAIDRLSSGEMTPAEANAITREANRIMAPIESALRVGRLLEGIKREAATLPPARRP